MKIDPDQYKLDHVKRRADPVKYYNIFENKLPVNINTMLLYCINNIGTLLMFMKRNPDAEFVVYDDQMYERVFQSELFRDFNITFFSDDEYEYLEVYNIIEEKFMKKFDCIIMNPPYDGLKNLYGKITLKAKEHAKTVVSLSPYLNYLSTSQGKSIKLIANKLSPFLKSYEMIDPSIFDAAFDTDICIFTFEDNIQNLVKFDDIYWSKFTNPNLTKSILNKLENYSIGDKSAFNHLINKNKFDEYKFKVAFTIIRGHAYNGVKSWDWTTLLDQDKMSNFTLKSSDLRDMYAFPFNTENECKNFVKYVNSDIFGYCILTKKTSINNSKWLFKIIPYFSYEKELTDQEIADKIGLTKEELDYIYDEMKDFGWKTQNK